MGTYFETQCIYYTYTLSVHLSPCLCVHLCQSMKLIGRIVAKCSGQTGTGWWGLVGGALLASIVQLGTVQSTVRVVGKGTASSYVLLFICFCTDNVHPQNCCFTKQARPDTA